MLSLQSGNLRLCDRLNRREAIRLGGLGALGLTLPTLLAAQSNAAPRQSAPHPPTRFGRAKRCILLYMWGGPPHHDTFDLKPNAPREIRGEFAPIPPSVPGIEISDHLPLLAEQADKFTILRSLNHRDGDHISASHDLLTGNTYPRISPLITARRSDHPHFGAVLSRLQPRNNGLPGYVQLPCLLQSNSGKVIPGQYGGFLGSRYDPFIINAVPNKFPIEDPTFEQFIPQELRLQQGLTPMRLAGIGRMASQLDQRMKQLDRSRAAASLNSAQQKALSLLSSPQSRRAFDLSTEDPRLRDRYGRHTFGQELLFSRRLIEAGVPLVTVYWRNGPVRTDIGWDNHINNFPNLKNWQLPPLDRAFSALLADMDTRGMLDDTLVVWMGEFGRSPKIDSNGGRNHWPQVFSAVMAGAGIPRGTIFGESDRDGAYPKEYPVSPLDLGATILHLLGIDITRHLYDQTERPHQICKGQPIEQLL